MVTRITMVRHGTTAWMEQGITHGRLDSHLSPKGFRQVYTTVSALRGKTFDAFYSSPAGRAVQTANILAKVVGNPPEILPDLMERDFGMLEGKTTAFLPSPVLAVFMLIGWVFPITLGGEPMRDVSRRAEKVLNLMAARHAGGSVILVSHSGLINMILKNISGRRRLFYVIPPASITEIELNDDGTGTILTPLKPFFQR